MCEWGTDVEIENLRSGGNHPDFPLHYRTWKIDSCIAPIIRALNLGGVETTQSCCGHGKGPGRIDLADGRSLSIADGSRELKRWHVNGGGTRCDGSKEIDYRDERLDDTEPEPAPKPEREGEG